ncbi:hypothetical protein FSP39_024989 [Pinctada imbricata]|uniref:Fibrinogen C-terminal domain-containing protein n=1 Tax=Pinctada imbricata TaxID=66713 RepID=A0AA88Y6H2_PINIB|nr:hypothetical protein FSP39_024989 [Pinctada imbricata]
MTEPCLTDTDALYDHYNMKFSTFDVDKDFVPEISCADYGQGAWWYNACLTSNLNGRYLGPGIPDDHTSNSCKGFNNVEYRPLKVVMMMLREDS